MERWRGGEKHQSLSHVCCDGGNGAIHAIDTGPERGRGFGGDATRLCPARRHGKCIACSQDDRKRAACLWFGMRGLRGQACQDAKDRQYYLHLSHSGEFAQCPNPPPADTRRGNCIEHLRHIIGVSGMGSVVGSPSVLRRGVPLEKVSCGLHQFGHQEKPAGTSSS